jgi:hypothetical protein
VTLTTAGVAVTSVATGPGIHAVQTFAVRLTNDLTALAGSVAVLFLAVNGLRFIASNGHPSRQMEARSGLVAAAAGLAIALSANLLVHLVVAALR